MRISGFGYRKLLLAAATAVGLMGSADVQVRCRFQVAVLDLSRWDGGQRRHPWNDARLFGINTLAGRWLRTVPQSNIHLHRV